MTNNQRLFQQEINRLQRSIGRLTKHEEYVQMYDLPSQPKRVTAKHIKQLKELKGRNFVSQIDVETGEIISEADAQEIYERKSRRKTYAKSKYDPEYQRRYRQEHRNEIRERNRRYRETHREQIRENQRKYREKNRDKINAQARERRKRRKQLEQQYYPAYSIYDAIYQVFQNALAELRSRGSDNIDVEVRAGLLQSAMSVMASSRATLGVEKYDEHLKKNEEEIVRDIWGIVYASDQAQMESYYTDLYARLNATDTLSIDTMMELSAWEEGGME